MFELVVVSEINGSVVVLATLLFVLLFQQGNHVGEELHLVAEQVASVLFEVLRAPTLTDECE